MRGMKGSATATVLVIALALAAALLIETSEFTGFYAFITGTTAQLEIWSSADSQGGSVIPFINEGVGFYANFTSIATGAPISGGGTTCVILFNISGSWTTPASMTYNGTSGLYEYTRQFAYSNNYTWNVTCDGSGLGYDANLSTLDSVMVYNNEWWNNSWKYRIKIDIENGDYNVTDWPVEIDVNFTDVLSQLGFSGTFDVNSTRIYEYNETGDALHELPSQFDSAYYGYDAAANAEGEVVFILNGTNENNTIRTFFLYFDILENGAKQNPNYTTNLTYKLTGDEIHINNTRLDMRLDTNRSENTSGLYFVKFNDPLDPQPFFVSSDGSQRTIEYMEYSNGTYNFSFDLHGNMTIIEGPVRLTLIQWGDEIIFGNTSQTTGEGMMEKRYYIYSNAGPEVYGSWINIEQNYTNTAGYSVDRNSTESGALAFDLIRGWTPLGSDAGADLKEGNFTDPYSWRTGSGGATEVIGIVNLNETVAGFFSTNSSIQGGRVGIELSDTTINSGQSIIQKALVYMGRGVTTEFIDIKNAMTDSPWVNKSDYHSMTLISKTDTDYDVYNRNETIFMTINVSYDPYGLHQYVNLTMDNATVSTSDDTVLVMYDDGTHGDVTSGDYIYTNEYNVSLDENPGLWNLTASMYDTNLVLLNTSLKQITITDQLYVNTIIYNPQGTTGRLVNATVDAMNNRQDVWHPGATLNCSVYDGPSKFSDVDPANIVDYGNGTYAFNFSAPGYFGLFTLNCTVNKSGNDGYDFYDFTAEEAETNVSIVLNPTSYTADNITFFQNESFILSVNATNAANGTAFNATINIHLPVNMTANETSTVCDDGEGNPDILIAKSCVYDFNITVLKETIPWNFTVNVSVSWNNTDQSPGYNETSMNVTVSPTYIMDILEENISAYVMSGVSTNIENISIQSFGNAQIENVTFNISGFPAVFNFSFVPVNYTSIGPGVTETNMIYLDIPLGYSTGEYNGTLNVTSINGGYEELNVSITVSGTNMTLDAAPLNFTADNITYYDNQSFDLSFNTSNIGNNTALSANVTLLFSDALIYTSNSTPYQCGDVGSGANCSGTFVIVISNGTPSGNYTVNISSEWFNPEIGILTNSTMVNITVLSNVTMLVPEEWVSGTAVHNATTVIGNFSMNSTGNDPIENIEFNISDELGNFGDFTFTLIPNISQTLNGNLSGGSFVIINLSVSVPLSYPNGSYLGYINITTSNAGYKQIDMNITVPETRTWTMDPTDCSHPETPEYGIMCNVTINNTGNVNISFNITPYADVDNEYNHTWPEQLSFVIGNQSGLILSFYYNITYDPITYYEGNYTLTATSSMPSYRNLSFLLTPFVEPLATINVTPNLTTQGSSVEILVSVTDLGGVAPINFTEVTVTAPNGSVYQIRMRRLGTGTNPYLYQEFFPDDPINGTWGTMIRRGNYTLSVFAEDNLGLNDTANTSFYAYTVVSVDVGTSRSNGQYYQSEIGTLYYNITDLEGLPLQGTNVSLEIRDPTNRTISLANSDFITDSMGQPSAYPYFQLFSDSPTGIYNITAVSAFNDTPISMMINDTSVVNFSVLETTPGMLTLDLEAPAETSVTDGHEVVAVVTDGATNVDADTIMVTLYDSLGNTIMVSQPMIQMSTGRYRMNYSTSASSNQGNWRWVVTMTKDSNNITKDVYTRLIGGPFDVRNITITDNTITTLGISVIIENTGDLSQDAYIQWNLTRVDNGLSLREGLDTVLIPANSEFTHVINPDNISYLGNVRITFIVTYSGTETAGAYDEFTTAEPSEEPPGPSPGPDGGGGAGGDAGGAITGPPPQPEIEISNYPDEIATEVGWAQYPSVTVNNTGRSTLHNVKLTLEGIPDSWYSVTPRLIPILAIGGSDTFVVNIRVPSGTEARQYYGSFNVTSDEASDSKLTSVIVFGSREDLVRYQLEKLKREFEDFKEDVDAAEQSGEKDLTRVQDIIDEIQHQIDLTEGYLTAKLFEEALESVTTGWRLLDRGRELLRDAPPFSPMTILAIPDWMITLILILLIVAMALFIALSRYRKKLDKVFKFRQEKPQAQIMEDIIGGGPDAEKKEEEEAEIARKQAEKEKIQKVMNLLEKEYKEGIISEKAYNELRQRNVEKIKQLGI